MTKYRQAASRTVDLLNSDMQTNPKEAWEIATKEILVREVLLSKKVVQGVRF